MARTPYGKPVGTATGGSKEGFGKGVAVRPAGKGGAGKATKLSIESQAGKRQSSGMSNKSSGSKPGGRRGALKADIIESGAGKRSKQGRGNVEAGAGGAKSARKTSNKGYNKKGL